MDANNNNGWTFTWVTIKTRHKRRRSGKHHSRSKPRTPQKTDALLADLQSTTSQISTYQHQQQHQQQSPQHQQHQQGAAPHHQQHSPAATATITVEVQREAQESPPPPLPPPPSQDVLDSVHSPDSQPIYEPTNMKQMHTMQTIHNSPGHTSSHKVTQQYHYQTQTNFGGAPPPVPQQPPPHPALMHQAMPQHQPMPQHQQPQVMPKPGMSALSHNLSELDTLLQDLNSAQFMAEVDRRNAENIAQSQRKVGPPVAPKPGRDVRDGRASVDNLLDQLESSLPPTESNQVNQSMGNQFSSHQQQHLVQQHHHQQQQQQQQFNNNASFQQASTATRELDDLMNSLSEFKIKENQTQQPQPFVSDPPYATPHKSPKLHSVSPPPTSPPPPISPHAAAQMTANNTAMAASSSGAATASTVSSSEVNNIVAPPAGNAQSSSMSTVSQAQTTTRESLDTMLGTLQTDMSRHGVTTVAKGHCAACNKPIIGQVITALGRIWHPEHFSCAHCREELGTQNFFERDGQPFCERDYHQLFSPRCAYCNGPILDKCVTALDKTWHPEHFFCAACGRMFGDDGFHEKDGKAFCRDDYFDMFAPKCGGCGRAIMDNYISALNRQWHPECFICQECHMPFGGGSFFDHDGMPYCETHYHAKRGSLCAHCQKPITGRCITAMYKKFHPEHFVCAFCLKQLNKGTFKEQNDKPYCHPCFVKLFG